MISRSMDTLTKNVPGLEETGLQLSRGIHQAVLAGGEPTRRLADLLHGTWLGHPLHPVLTDVAIGAWTLAALFDVLSAGPTPRPAEKAADTLIAVGAAAAVPTALTGLADYSTIPKRAAGIGLLHALLNILALGLYLASWLLRRNGQRGLGISLSTLGLGSLTLSAWLGGHLAYKERVGMDHNRPVTQPEEWQAVLAQADLAEQEPRRVEVAGYPVLLYRYTGTIYAVGANCSHAGGPLEEGQFEGWCVQCPWHDSVFDLRDGSIQHGPTTYPQPSYAARINDGQIEVRIKRQG